MAAGPPLRRLSRQRVTVYTLDPHVRCLQHPGLQTSRQRCRFVGGGHPRCLSVGLGERLRRIRSGGMAQGRSWCHPGPCRSSVENARCATQCFPCTRTKGFWTHARNPYCPQGRGPGPVCGSGMARKPQGRPKPTPRLSRFLGRHARRLVARLLWSPASLTRDRPLWSGALGFTILPLRVGPGDFAVG